MKALLIPVKESANAKQRLAPHFSAAARAELASAFWQDFFDVIAQARGFDAVFVVSSHAAALQRAREFGWQTITETEQHSESASVDFASARCEEIGFTSVLRIPVDLPLIQAADVESIFAEISSTPGAAIIPSADGDGTNALLRTPPTIFRSHFGPDSFRKHCTAAREAGCELLKLRNPRIEVDVDTIEDLRALNPAEVRGRRTLRWLERYGLESRVNTGRAIAASSNPG